MVVENSKDQKPGTAFLGTGTIEERGHMSLEKDQIYEVQLVLDNANRPAGLPFGAFRIGAAPHLDLNEGIRQAVELASSSDAVILVAGLNADWESEGC